MADPYASGLAFRNFLSNVAGSVTPAVTALANPFGAAGRQGVAAGDAAAPSIHDFLGGVFGAARPSVTVPLPAATKAAAPAKAPAAAAKAAAPFDLGQLTPAAAAVLAHVGSPPAKTAAAAADPLGALGKLSFRQLLTLSQASENLTPKGSVKAPSATDAAGAALASIYQQQFKSSIDAAGKDPAKQQAAVDAFEKKMLPIALKGNTADEYLYGNQ